MIADVCGGTGLNGLEIGGWTKKWTLGFWGEIPEGVEFAVLRMRPEGLWRGFLRGFEEILKNAENVNGVKLEFGTFLGHGCYNL